MLDFLWPARHEHGLDAKTSAWSPSAASFLTQPSAPNQLKRKRGQCNNAVPAVTSKPDHDVATQVHSQSTHPGHKGLTPPDTRIGSSDFVTLAAPTEGTIVAHMQRADTKETQHVTTVAGDLTGKSPTKALSLEASDTIAKLPPDSVDELQTLRETIESQFSLEILIKNRELRLIEQELAKCQIAYEQIRRCQAIPYPSQSSSSSQILSVSNGSGLPLDNAAPEAVPWGVLEGPYSRHYGYWLLPDSTFDANFVEETNFQPAAAKRLPDRHTRGVHTEKGTFGVTSRSHRGSMSTRLTAQPHERTDSKVEKGPMIVARKSDGHMVKLVCVDCRRSDFNSVQGFINHCRIAHSRQFVSHEAAIEASGEEVDGDTSVVPTADAISPKQSAKAGLVHPLITAAPPLSPKLVDKHSPHHVTHSQSLAAGATRSRSRTSQTARSLDFIPSPQTPYLSALLSKLGRDDNLQSKVEDAKRTDEIDLIRSMHAEDSDEGDDSNTAEEQIPQSQSTRAVGQSSFRPANSGGVRPATLPSARSPPENGDFQHPLPRSLAFDRVQWSPPSVDTGNLSFGSHDGPINDLASPSINLSPGITDPNPAPSLVSDDGDYDHLQSDSDSSEHTDSEAGEDHFPQPRLIDDDSMDMDDHGHFGFADAEKPHRPRFRRRRPSSKYDSDIMHRHVAFASQESSSDRDEKAFRNI